jgi:hypothetical protein
VAHSGAQTPAPTPPYPQVLRPSSDGLLAGGTNGNELLTALTGAALIVLLGALGVTIIRIGSLLWEHLFIGVLLLGPLTLKLASTGYRFMRYYTGNRRYVEHGPPEPLPRVIAPAVVISTLVVFVTGVILLLGGPSTRSTWFPIHKISFFVWLAFTALHVLWHLPTLMHGLRTDFQAPSGGAQLAVPGRSGRALSLASALTLGVVLAVLAIPDFAAWIHAQPYFHHHHH